MVQAYEAVLSIQVLNCFSTQHLNNINKCQQCTVATQNGVQTCYASDTALNFQYIVENWTSLHAILVVTFVLVKQMYQAGCIGCSCYICINATTCQSCISDLNVSNQNPSQLCICKTGQQVHQLQYNVNTVVTLAGQIIMSNVHNVSHIHYQLIPTQQQSSNGKCSCMNGLYMFEGYATCQISNYTFTLCSGGGSNQCTSCGNNAQCIVVVGKKNITDPLNPDHIIEAELVKLTVHPDLACSVYSSCSRTAFASQVTAMMTPGGFFMFQGEKAVTQGGQSIDIQFSSDNSLALDGISECDAQFNSIIDENGIVHQFDDYGYEIHNSCGCNTCDAACSHAATIYTSTGVFYGFDGFTVIVTWSAVVILAFVITFIEISIKGQLTINMLIFSTNVVSKSIKKQYPHINQ